MIRYFNGAVLSNDFTFSLLCFLMKAFEEILNVFKIKVLYVCINHIIFVKQNKGFGIQAIDESLLTHTYIYI